MAYQILRVQKLKSLLSVKRSLNHAFRTQETPNADPEKFAHNQNFGAKSDRQAMSIIKALMPSKLRKNGVVCVEHLITASPEWFEGKSNDEQNEYFKHSLTWLRKKWGKENVVCGGIHRDEKTPHMYIYVVPKDYETGRLNCRKWLGERDALSNMQSAFHTDVAINFGLERGLKGSKAKHQTIQKYYAKLNNVDLSEHQKPSKKDLLLAAAGFDSPVNQALERADLVSLLSNEKDQVIKLHRDERLSLVRSNMRSKKKNNDLKNKYKDNLNAEAEFTQKALKAQAVLDTNKTMLEQISSLSNDLRALELENTDLNNEIHEMKNCDADDPIVDLKGPSNRF